MDLNNIFTVTNEDLDRLDPAEAVRFFRELLWAEARRLGIEMSQINVSSQVNVPDGGVDATVNAEPSAAGSDIIKPGKTCYQIKSGKAFKPWRKSVIRKELFGSGPPPRENLGEGIRACLDADGTYVLVCTRIDLVDKQRRNVLTYLNEYLKSCGYQNPRVEVWSQNNLIGFLQRFPSLALQVNGRSEAQFQTHQSWSENADMRGEFVPGQAQDDLISQIRNDLRRNDDTIHVRVLGEPGIGKTRLILEATRADDLAPLVVYCTAAQFRDKLMREILREGSHFSVIVVIDECDPDGRSYIWNKLKHREPRLKVVTIYNDHEEEASGLTYAYTEPLNEEQIRGIIRQSASISNVEADRWVELCSGSPRVAHVIAENLRSHPEDLLKPLGEVNIWERYVAGSDKTASQEVEQRRLVLQHLALFKRFGFEDSVANEARAIAKKVEMADPQITWARFRRIVDTLRKRFGFEDSVAERSVAERSVANEARAIAKKVEMADPQITWARFQRIVDTLRKRKILQGEFTLYITPKALHIKLWTEWWEIYGRRPFDLEEFTQDLTPKLVEWFYEMFQYAAESEAASRIVKSLLGPDGPFRDGDYLNTRLGSRFFSALTEADPKAALKCLMRTLGTWDKETLLQFTGGRRDVIWALEKIAVWRDLFADAARLLLALGEAENEGWSNNASGVFAELFSLGYGPVAPTEASPAERFPVLREAFESDSKARRLLALAACKVGLQQRKTGIRTAGAEYQGLRNEPELWTPQTYGELFDAYRGVWNLLAEQLACLSEEERKYGAAILLEQAHGLGQIANLSDMIVDTLRMLSVKALVDEKQLIKTVVEFLRSADKDLLAETRQRWEQLREELVGSDFPSMMQRYVGMALHSDLFDENKNYLEHGPPQVHSLAQQVVETPSLLQPELQWLVTTAAQNGGNFGYALGKRDDGFSLLPRLLDAQRDAGENANGFFLGGYFRAIFHSDVAQWEEYLDAVSEDTTLNVLVPELTRYSGLTDRAGLRLFNLVQKGAIPPDSFRFFIAGKAIDNLSEEVFTAWMEFLLSCSDKIAPAIAIELFYFYYIHGSTEPSLPFEFAYRLLAHPAFFEAADGDHFNAAITDDYWAEIGKAFLNLHPQKSLELAALMVAHFGENGTIVGGIDTDAESVLTEITKRYPKAVWKCVSKYLEQGNHFSRTLALERWLRGSNFSVSSSTDEEKRTLSLIPREDIWNWVDRDVENRARYFAYRLVPHTLSVEAWPNSFARATLVRYGKRDDVRSNLRANYSMESWTGDRSLHFEQKREKLLRIRETESDANVKRWIDEYVEKLEARIEHAKIDEEREF